ncbi:DUF935 family protein, partial [Acetobacter sp. DsW_063]|uniref:phage portal protein family protein n=1 Tax=Acetobacter sp. DsW_063 TaxID=1514894 RepID=UPI000B628543
RMVQEDIERSDSLLLSTTVNEQLVRPMIDASFGGPVGDYPVVMIGRPDEIPIAELVSLLQWGGPQGLKVRAQDIYDRAGLTPPEPGDETVGVLAQPQPVQPSHDLPGEQRPAQALPGRASPPTTATSREAADGGKGAQENTGNDAPAEELHVRVGRLLSLHVQEDGPGVIEIMTRRLARNAERALGDLPDQVRKELEQASSLDDLSERLEMMGLDDEAFGNAMQAGVLIAQLAGEASVLGGLKRG